MESYIEAYMISYVVVNNIVSTAHRIFRAGHYFYQSALFLISNSDSEQ
jgi:hypothetical protein